MCYDRVKEETLPACVEACPTGATQFGDRDEMIVLAKLKLSENPEKYYQYIYGLEEVGGTSVFYLSPVPFEELGFNTKLSKTAFPNFTHEALSKIPTLVSVGGVLLTGFYWLTNRKNEIAREKSEQQKKLAR